jgi:hypothetical protein
MDEAGWLTSQYAHGMIWSLFSRAGKGGRIKDERFRRFGIACTRRAIAALPGGNSPALDRLEAVIGPALKDVLPNLWKLHASQMRASADRPFGQLAFQHAAAAVLKCLKTKPTQAAVAQSEALEAVVAMRGHAEGWKPGSSWPRRPKHEAAYTAEGAFQAGIARDIFGNPFRPPVAFEPSWHTNTVAALAKQMFELGDFSGMPILADALQEAGCDNDDILSHCRDVNQPHARGCWVTDLVLDKQ